MDEKKPSLTSRRKKIIAVIIVAVIVSAIFSWYYIEQKEKEMFSGSAEGGAIISSWENPKIDSDRVPGDWVVKDEPKAGEPFYYTTYYERFDKGGDNLPADINLQLDQGPTNTSLTSVIITTSTGGYLETAPPIHSNITFGDNETIVLEWWPTRNDSALAFSVDWYHHPVRDVTYSITIEMVVDSPGQMFFHTPYLIGTLYANNTWVKEVTLNGGDEKDVWLDEVHEFDVNIPLTFRSETRIVDIT